MNKTIQHYNQHADQFNAQYQSVSFEQVHKSWEAFWPSPDMDNCHVLDIGAGSGRDAIWYAKRGCSVYAVEPSEGLRAHGQTQTADQDIVWLSDILPELRTVDQLSLRFDLIVLSAVWMHVPLSVRKRAFRKLANFLAPNGKLVITLRFGDFDDNRSNYSVSSEEIEQLAKDHALKMRLKTNIESDALGRNDIKWQTLVFSLPDDGSGDLLKVRHVIVNDNKSSTYKLALLRTLLRIADAHPGAVLDRSDNKVALPLGLVAMYWIRQYKRLLDRDFGDGQGIQQNSNTNKGLGFVSADGWARIKHLAPEDLSIGSLFVGREAEAIQKTIKDTLSTIKDGPVKHIYQGDKTNPVFQMERTPHKIQDSIYINQDFLGAFGQFVLDESLWDCLKVYHSWIEPLVVNQWITEMKRYELNRERNISLQSYYDCLVWLDAEHDTAYARKRIDILRARGGWDQSVWSGKKITDNYHVDHCLPFAHWPNNDRWNLLPTTVRENLQKSDRVPTRSRLADAKGRIIDFWQLAWENELDKQSFFSEAEMSLPNVPIGCNDFEAVFEAMGLQVRGVKSRLLVGEW
ncbi:class I SAM-dependent methyltransferase [Veronia pacifica]|uniref:SAM-dependent methyltransferase n=1 Tax=Veronia pacifica TaxID=1080227 RepID=A0A1C3EMB4_9GAMM|nr:class I SAM-dependent methyltransferase [Veronia pacifica]ODA34374.1 SAM-dependent methyltransferase [Veronia pacifica]